MNTPHIDSLKRLYGGPMSAEQTAILRDLKAFIDFCIENGLSFPLALGTIAHDVSGLTRSEPAFTPQTKGYSKVLEELRAAKTDPTLQKELSEVGPD